jgi:hypothetical protein
MTVSQIPLQPTVVFAGDLAVGLALEVLLSTVVYDVRLLKEPLTLELTGMLRGAHLLILGPRLGAELKEALLSTIESLPEMAALPVLELATAECNGAREGRAIREAWPCRIADLQQRTDLLVQRTCWCTKARRHTAILITIELSVDGGATHPVE